MNLRDEITAVLRGPDPETCVQVMNDHAIATEVYGRQDEDDGADEIETNIVGECLAAMEKEGEVMAASAYGITTYFIRKDPA